MVEDEIEARDVDVEPTCSGLVNASVLGTQFCVEEVRSQCAHKHVIWTHVTSRTD